MDNRYETAETYTRVSEQPQKADIRPSPSTPMVLADLSDAAKTFADAASRFIEARDALTEAQLRWQNLHDQLAKHREQEGV